MAESGQKGSESLQMSVQTFFDETMGSETTPVTELVTVSMIMIFKSDKGYLAAEPMNINMLERGKVPVRKWLLSCCRALLLCQALLW